MRDGSDSLKSFRVSIFHRNSKETLRTQSGTGEEWKADPVVTVPIRDESYSIRLSTVWVDLFESGLNRIEQDVDGLCTIIKWGDTMQLREPCRVVIEIER